MSGFSFGAAKTTAPPPFGATNTSTFGTPNTAFQLGIAPQPQSQPAPNLFGTSTPVKPTFSAPTAMGTTPGLFGTTTTAATAPQLGGGLSFGAPTIASTAPTGLTGFGATSIAPTLNFGAPTTSATMPTFNLGSNLAATSTSTGLTFGAPTTGTSGGGLTFGATPVGTSAGLTTPGLGLKFGATTTAANTSAAPTSLFSGFGIPASTSTGLTFGTTTTTASLGFGLGGTTASTLPSNPLTASTSTAPSSTGLGGIASTQIKSTVSAQKEVPPKDNPLPNEITQTVEQFKDMLKQQKSYCADIARCSVREFRKVEQEIDSLNQSINELENQLQKNRVLAEKLKYEAAKSLQHVEMAQRTHDTPPGLQYENTAPLRYFLELADSFERQMQNIKAQIECADKFVKSNKSDDVLTPQDLAMGMRRLHEIFVALAGRLQTVHTQVESAKESFLNIRKHIFNDSSDPFAHLATMAEQQIYLKNRMATFYSPPKVACGPTPFGNLILGSVNATLQQHSNSPPAYGQVAAPVAQGFPTAPSFGMQQPSNTTLFGTNTTNVANNNASFQLQKPPTGNKRGKIL